MEERCALSDADVERRDGAQDVSGSLRAIHGNARANPGGPRAHPAVADRPARFIYIGK